MHRQLSKTILSLSIAIISLFFLVIPVLAAEPCLDQQVCAPEQSIAAIAANSPTQPNAAQMPAAFVNWLHLDTRTFLYDEPWGERLKTVYPTDQWFGAVDERVVDGEVWYKTSDDKWIHSGDVTPWTPSSLRGYHLTGTEQGSLAFVIEPNAPVLGAANWNAKPTHTLARYTPVGILGTDNGLLRVAPGQWLRPDAVRAVKLAPRPDKVAPDAKWIDVNLTQQIVSAYEGDRLVFATLTSTGKDPTPTRQGLFYVYLKKVGEYMGGGWADNDPYMLAEVPWTMYFTAGFAIHGAYWHDLYGEVRSHGCVNLTPDDAKFLFTWSGPTVPAGELSVKATADNQGTWVYVHD